MAVLTRDDVTAVLGPVDDHLIAAVLATGATRDEFAMAEAWYGNDEAPMNAGDRLASGRVGQILDLLQAADDSRLQDALDERG